MSYNNGLVAIYYMRATCTKMEKIVFVSFWNFCEHAFIGQRFNCDANKYAIKNFSRMKLVDTHSFCFFF